jgi:hypothetical protein
MKRMFFLMLTLMALGAASVNAQVRIGGNGDPNPTAVLDLNVSDDVDNGLFGLALPRVNLTDTLSTLNGLTPTNGMMVYNTNAALGTGVYFWTDVPAGHWVNVSNPAVNSVDSTSIKQMGALVGQTLTWDGSAWTPRRIVQNDEIKITIPIGQETQDSIWYKGSGPCATYGGFVWLGASLSSIYDPRVTFRVGSAPMPQDRTVTAYRPFGQPTTAPVTGTVRFLCF